MTEWPRTAGIVDVVRTETEVAANVVHLLREAGIIGNVRTERICAVLGISIPDLALARHRFERHGSGELRVRERSETEGPDPESGRRAFDRVKRSSGSAHPGERLCARCSEWIPLSEFDPRSPGDPRPRKMCRICAGEFERDHFVAVKKAKALHQVVAYLTATKGDAFAGRTCGNCHEPIRLGQTVTITAEPVHAKCPKVRR